MVRTAATLILFTSTALAAPTVNVVFNFNRSLGEGAASALQKRGGDYFMSLYTGGHRGCTVYKNTHQPCGTVLRLTPPSAKNANWQGKLIYDFLPNGDGYFPTDAPTKYDNLDFVLTTSRGGQLGGGALVELLSPVSIGMPWTEKVIASFDPNTPESFPFSRAYTDASHNVFVAFQSSSGMFGAVVEFSPPANQGGPWTENIVREFQFSDGCIPTNGMRPDQQGNLYLAMYACGPNYAGTAVKLLAPANGGSTWSEQVLYNFGATSNDAVGPSSGFVEDAAGNLYGLTYFGGSTNSGAAYELSPPVGGGTQWTEQVLYSFTGGADGTSPYRGLVRDAAGNLFVTTLQGGDPTCNCGALIELSPPASGQGPYTETTLHAFTGTPDGAYPTSITPEDNGNLLITTTSGGTANEGALIEVTNSGFVVK